MCGLLLDKILQVIDAGNLCVSGGSVNRTFFSLFPELEDLVSNLIIGLFGAAGAVALRIGANVFGSVYTVLFDKAMNGLIQLVNRMQESSINLYST